MRISVRPSNKRFKIIIIVPSALLYSRISERLLIICLKRTKDGARSTGELSPELIGDIFNAVRKFRRKSRHFVLADVKTADGVAVRITL